MIILLVILVIIYKYPSEFMYKYPSEFMKEMFTNVPLLVLNVERSPYDINILNSNTTKLDILKDVDHVKNDVVCKDCNLNVMDFYSLIYSPKELKLLVVLPTEKTCVFIKQRNNTVDETVGDVFRKKKTVGYFDTSHAKLIKMIALSYGINKPNLIKLSVPYKFDPVGTTQNQKSPYCIFFLKEIEASPINSFNTPDVLDMGDYDLNVLKAILPFVIVKNKDFKRYVTQYMDRYSIKTCFCFDNVLAGDNQFNESKYGAILNDIHTKLHDGPKINYYAMYGTTKDNIEGYEGIEGIEGYEGKVKISLRTKSNVSGFYESSTKTYTIMADNIEGVQLSKDDNVILTQQIREEENGTYVVVESTDKFITI